MTKDHIEAMKDLEADYNQELDVLETWIDEQNMMVPPGFVRPATLRRRDHLKRLANQAHAMIKKLEEEE